MEDAPGRDGAAPHRFGFDGIDVDGGDGYGSLVTPLFEGEPQPLPPQQGSTWTVTFPPAPKPAPVRHAVGYAPFVSLAATFGTDVRDLFDLWRFAHFVRAHREALAADRDLLQSAVIFVGDSLIARFPECFWSHHPRGLVVENEHAPVEVEPGRWEVLGRVRSLGVGDTVPALLHADEARFMEFEAVVDAWRR